LRISLLDHDNFLAFHCLCFHLHLIVGLEGTLILSLLAHPLHGVHDIRLLGQERVAEVGRPLDVICKSLHNIRKRRQGLDGWIPVLFHHRVHQRLIF